MLENIKKSLRISTDQFDSEIENLISAAKEDLNRVGVKIDESKFLIKRAIDLYCKANFYLSTQDGEKYLQRYEKLKSDLSMTGDYNEE